MSSDPAVGELKKTLTLAIDSGAPASVVESIKKVLDLTERRDQFTLDSCTPHSEACQHILEQTQKNDWQKVKDDGLSDSVLSPRMLSGHLEGQFMKSLVSMHNAKRVLDIGMYTGYSAMSMAEALPADGELITLDINKYLETFTGSLLQKSPHGKKIKIIIGPSTETLKSFIAEGKTFDVIFMDAAKSDYKEQLKMIFENNLLVPRGTLLVDNAFSGGRAYTPEENHPTTAFSELVRSLPNLHSVLLPIRDGVYIIRRKCDVEGATE